MPSFERGTVVRVPFPYTDRDTRQRRPALVVSEVSVGPPMGLLWVVMITSAKHQPWPGDVPVEASQQTGLPVPSVIRSAKIATIEARDADAIGHVGGETQAVVDRYLAQALGLTVI